MFSRQLFLTAVLSLLIILPFSLNNSNADGLPNFSIDTVSVTRPSTANCNYQWSATVKNNGTTAVNGSLVTLQAYQGNSGGSWNAASGGKLSGSINPNQVQSESKTFVRLDNKNQLKMQVYFQGTVIAEKITELPAEPQPAVEISNCNIADTSYTVTIRNLLAEAFPGLTVQGYTASSANPNNWAAGGGMGIACLSANGIYKHTGPKPAGNDIIKIMIIRGGVTVAERIFSFSLPPANPSDRLDVYHTFNRDAQRDTRIRSR